MTRINIVGRGFLDLSEPLSYKIQNSQFRFSDISLGRTTEFSVPANLHNRELLGYPEDPMEDGEAMRRSYDAELVHEGGLVKGLLEVRSLESPDFRCVFFVGGSKTLEAMMGRKLKDIPTTLPGVEYGKTPTYAGSADIATPVDIIAYHNGTDVEPKPYPSVNAAALAEDLLTGVGALYAGTIDPELWLVATTLYGGKEDTVTFTQRDESDFGLVQTEANFSIVDVDLQWCKSFLFGAQIGGGTVPSKAFQAKTGCTLTFPTVMPTGVYLVKWQPKLSQYGTLGGVSSSGFGDPHTRSGERSLPLSGLTVTLNEGDIFFFAGNQWEDVFGADHYFGYKGVKHDFSVTVDVSINSGMVAGQTWYVRNNLPDMTLFEFLRSLALATGGELMVDTSTVPPTVSIRNGSYGLVKALDKVVSIESLSRRVGCWGDSTRVVKVDFNSRVKADEFRLLSSYEIDSDQVDGEQLHTCEFNEGMPSSFGWVAIYPPGSLGQEVKSTNTAWTLGLGGSQAAAGDRTLLGRIEAPVFEGYEDLAACSTRMRVKCAMDEADFLALDNGHVFQWRGSLFIWTDAEWAKGVAALTLQKVSSLSADAVPLTYVQDGLVLHLDGINKGDVAGHWLSLVGGYDYSPYGSPTFHDDCVEFDGVDDYLRNNYFVMPETNVGTIEVVVSIDAIGASGYGTVIASKSDSARLCMVIPTYRYVRWSTGNGKSNYRIPVASLVSMTINDDRCLVNGSPTTSSGTAAASTTTNAASRIGCSYGSGANRYFLDGKIYSIRVYNRKLTEAEMRQNLAVDVARFGISI